MIWICFQNTVKGLEDSSYPANWNNQRKQTTEQTNQKKKGPEKNQKEINKGGK